MWVWCSSTSCRRCSTVRSHMYAVSSVRASRRADVAAGGELLERFERRARTDRWIVAAVHQLQQLHRELDVADAARPALHLAVRQALAAQHLFRTRLHRARFAHRAGVEHVGPHEPRRTPDERVARAPRIAGDRVGLDERLQLPVLRPPFPVRLEPLERAAQRAGATFGPQVGVGAEHDPVRGRPAHRRQHGACHALGLGLIAFVHEHHVDVARVVELVPAELAHADDRELGRPVSASVDGDVEAGLRQIARARSPTSRRSAIASRSRPAMRTMRCRFHWRRARAGSSEVSSARAEPA